MSYGKGARSRLPLEYASRLGHFSWITDPVIHGLLKSFQASSDDYKLPVSGPTGTMDLSGDGGGIERVIAIDGSAVVVPHQVHRGRSGSAITAVAILLRMSEYEALRANPLIDPRDFLWDPKKREWAPHTFVPLVGIHSPGLSVRESLRLVINSTLGPGMADLGTTLKFLVYREWLPEWPETEKPPSMDCRACGETFELPYRSSCFDCPACHEPHFLSDYLGLDTDTEDRGREEVARDFMTALETLILFHLVRLFRDDKVQMGKTLFVKDGPLLLRASLGRLIAPIYALIAHLRAQDVPLHLVGVEKGGQEGACLAAFLPHFEAVLPNPGDYYVLSDKFFHEEIKGCAMPAGNRNRSRYGAKVVARLGPRHIVALNVPTSQFLLDPAPADLIGLRPSLRTLSRLRSYQYENALVPLVLANSRASMSWKPSTEIIDTFLSGVLGEK